MEVEVAAGVGQGWRQRREINESQDLIVERKKHRKDNVGQCPAGTQPKRWRIGAEEEEVSSSQDLRGQ